MKNIRKPRGKSKRRLLKNQLPWKQFKVTSEWFSESVNDLSNFTGELAVYQNAPTFAFIIIGYTIDKKETLTNPVNDQLLQALTIDNYIVE